MRFEIEKSSRQWGFARLLLNSRKVDLWAQQLSYDTSLGILVLVDLETRTSWDCVNCQIHLLIESGFFDTLIQP